MIHKGISTAYNWDGSYKEMEYSDCHINFMNISPLRMHNIHLSVNERGMVYVCFYIGATWDSCTKNDYKIEAEILSESMKLLIWAGSRWPWLTKETIRLVDVCFIRFNRTQLNKS